MANHKKSKQKKAANGSSDATTHGPIADQNSDEFPVGDVPAKARNIDLETYERELRRLQIELVKLQEWIKERQKRLLVVFEGRDAAGKGGTIKRISERLNPRICRIVALGKPTSRERNSWYFQRYVEQLPANGEMVLMDRSWYNRAGVERIMGFCTDEEYHEFLVSCPGFERLLVRSGLIVVKYWFSISMAEQEKRFRKRLRDPTKHWKLSEIDLESRSRWNEYSQAKDVMMQHTDTSHAPWYVVEADSKRRARLNCIHHLLEMVPYEEITPEVPDALSPRPVEMPLPRTPKTDRHIVPEVY
ncbi:MAG: polyphosphate kinase 2 [Pirellulaceae bacterium]